MKEEIINWLRGPRPYAEGAALYAKYGTNVRMKVVFRQCEDSTLRGMLAEELRRLSGLSGAELRSLPRMAHAPHAESAPVQPEATAQFTDSGKAAPASPDVVKKVVTFRERFPFLAAPDCPDSLKILVNDMFTSYGKWKDARRALLEMPGDGDLTEAARLAETVVEEFLADEAMWKELEYYKQHHEILGEAPQMRRYRLELEITEMTDMALLKAKNTAKANLSKNEKRLKQTPEDKGDRIKAYQELIDKWRERLMLINAEERSRLKNA